MKGAFLVGDARTHLYHLAIVMSKQLLPVYCKQIIYYHLITLVFACIKYILIMRTSEDNLYIKHVLGDWHKFEIFLQYKAEQSSDGFVQVLC